MRLILDVRREATENSSEGWWDKLHDVARLTFMAGKERIILCLLPTVRDQLVAQHWYHHITFELHNRGMGLFGGGRGLPQEL
jgi:hypothetical protein